MKNKFIRSKMGMLFTVMALVTLSGCKVETLPDNEITQEIVTEMATGVYTPMEPTDDACRVLEMTDGGHVSLIFDNRCYEYPGASRAFVVMADGVIIEVRTGSPDEFDDSWNELSNWESSMFQVPTEKELFQMYKFAFNGDNEIEMYPTVIESKGSTYLFPYAKGYFRYSGDEYVYVTAYIKDWQHLITDFVDPADIDLIARNMIEKVEENFCLAIGDYSQICLGSFSEETSSENKTEDFRSY